MSVAVPLVAAVCGSRGDASANRLLLDALVEIAGGRVRVASSFDVADVPHFDPDAVDDPPDAVVRWRSYLDATDALVLAVPEYAASIPGTLKNALDWLVGSSTLYGMPIVVLSASSTGGRNVLPAMALTLGYQGAIVVATHGVEAPRSRFDASGRLVDAEVRDALGTIVVELLDAVADPAPGITRIRAWRPSTP